MLNMKRTGMAVILAVALLSISAATVAAAESGSIKVHARNLTLQVNAPAVIAIARGVRQEVEARQAIAARALEGHDFRSHRNALHLWLALSDKWTAAKLSEAVRPFNVLVRPSDLFNTGEARMPNFVRLSLVAPKSRDDLQYAMEVIANQLSNSL